MKVSTNNKIKSRIITLGLMALPFLSLAQENEVATVSYFSNALFNTLICVIILLAVIIMALSGVLKNITGSDVFIQRLKKGAEELGKKTNASSVLFIFFSLLTVSGYAGNPKPADSRIGGIDQFTFYFLIAVIALEIIFIVVMLSTLQFLLKSEAKANVGIANKPREKTILDKLSDAVEVENEESILLDHDYDGIKELDNNLPPWWKYGFYLTILVAIVYLINYHVTNTAPLQAEEYNISVRKAEAEIAEFMKNSANNVDESTVKLLTDASDIASGKDIFMSVCSACHGKLGEGGVGPNLTDDYWIHPGSVKEIFKTIKYGYPDKGMKSWKDDYSPIQMAQLTSYIKTLRGTNPPKGKEKQGDLYIEESVSPTDSASVKVDSLNVAVADTLKK
jgi:cytochrome c oxidase cbb3-type subunit 3